MHDEPLAYTVPDVGRRLGISRSTAYDAARRGEIPTISVGRRLLVPRAALERMLSTCESAKDALAAVSGGDLE